MLLQSCGDGVYHPDVVVSVLRASVDLERHVHIGAKSLSSKLVKLSSLNQTGGSCEPRVLCPPIRLARHVCPDWDYVWEGMRRHSMAILDWQVLDCQGR